VSNDLRVEHLWKDVQTHIEMHERYQARNISQVILAIKPTFLPARTFLASYFIEEGEYDLALLHAAFAYSRDSEFSALREVVAEAYFLTGMYAEALECLAVLMKKPKVEKKIKERYVFCQSQVSTTNRPNLCAVRSLKANGELIGEKE
jgi:hypothetical protein